MKKNGAIYYILILLVSCKPAELKRMEEMTRKVIVFTSETIIEARLIDKDENMKSKMEGNYFWYGKGRIYNTQGACFGKLLHGQYTVYHKETKNLVESGEFDHGLKTGKWLNWDTGGKLKEMMMYRNGFLDGLCFHFDSLGQVKDTLRYKKGILKIKKLRTDSTRIFKRFQRLFNSNRK